MTSFVDDQGRTWDEATATRPKDCRNCGLRNTHVLCPSYHDEDGFLWLRCETKAVVFIRRKGI